MHIESTLTCYGLSMREVDVRCFFFFDTCREVCHRFVNNEDIEGLICPKRRIEQASVCIGTYYHCATCVCNRTVVAYISSVTFNGHDGEVFHCFGTFPFHVAFVWNGLGCDIGISCCLATLHHCVLRSFREANL